MQKNGYYDVTFGNDHVYCQQLHEKVTCLGPNGISYGILYIFKPCVVDYVDITSSTQEFLAANKSLQM